MNVGVAHPGHDRAGGRRPAQGVVAPHPLWRSVVLHLLPGVVIAALFYSTGPLVMRSGFPAIAGGLAAATVGILGLELGWMLREGRRRTGRWSLRAAMPWRPGPFTWRKAALVIALIGYQFVVAVTLGGWRAPIVETFFSWVPDWAVNPLPAGFAATAPQWIVLTTAIGLLVLNGIVLPVAEELYFRGYLLPRIARFGWLAPVLSAVLFSLYHFWTPWDFVLRIVLLGPSFYVVWRTRDIRISMATHAAMNTLGFALNTGPALLGG